MAKEDGLIIAIEFTQGIVPASVSGNLNAFSVTFQRYTMVPGGVLVNDTRTVVSIEQDEEDENIIYLNFGAGVTRSIQNAVGNITIGYNATQGRLRGLGGPVASFSQSFTPTDLLRKDNPLEREHLTMGLNASGLNTKIFYTDTKTLEHINMSLSALGKLTYIGDL